MFHVIVTKTLLGLALISLVIASAFAQSQANTGTIEGTIADQNGGGIPGAKVTIVNTGTNFTR